MKCKQCGTQVTAHSKFCLSCGSQIYSSDQGKKPEEVTIDWLKGIVERLEYEVKTQEEDQNILFAKSKEQLDLVINLKKDINLITVMTFLSIKKIGWGGRKELLSTLNKANSMGSICTYYFDEEDNTLTIYSFIQLMELLAERDIVSLLETFQNEALSTLGGSDLIKFCE